MAADFNDTEPIPTVPYPMDFDAITKGDYIQPDEVERITHMDRNTRDYGLGVMKLQERIERECADRGYPVVTKQEKGGISILTDEEAVAYCERAFILKMGGMRTAHGKMLQIDRKELSEESAKQLDRNTHVNGWTLKAMWAGRRESFKSLAHVRTVPGLPQEIDTDSETVSE